MFSSCAHPFLWGSFEIPSLTFWNPQLWRGVTVGSFRDLSSAPLSQDMVTWLLVAWIFKILPFIVGRYFLFIWNWTCELSCFGLFLSRRYRSLVSSNESVLLFTASHGASWVSFPSGGWNLDPSAAFHSQLSVFLLAWAPVYSWEFITVVFWKGLNSLFYFSLNYCIYTRSSLPFPF